MKRKKLFSQALSAVMAFGISIAAMAGEIDSTRDPSQGSGMCTLQELYDYLMYGTTPTERTSFTEPSAGPGSTMKTTGEILADVKSGLDNCTATPAQVQSGVRFFSTNPGSWGPQVGSIPEKGNVTGADGSLSITIPDGMYSGGKTATARDRELDTKNIKSGVSIFGVIGSVIQSSGTATTGDVLATKTFSNATQAGVMGTMPNRGAVSITPGTANQSIAAGYHNGSGVVQGDSELISGNIRSGASIFGVPGSVTPPSGTAALADVLSGKTFSNTGGTGLTGTMPNRGAVSITPGTSNQSIAAGYHNGAGVVLGDSDLNSENIRSGASIFGVPGSVTPPSGTAALADVLSGKTFSNTGGTGLTGTMPNRGAVSITPGTSNQSVAAGYHNGSGVVQGDSDLVSEEIACGVTIFGVTGIFCPRLPATTGQTTSYWPGDDGTYQMGTLPAVAPCEGGDGCGYNRTNLGWSASQGGTRLVDQGNGTVLDTLTGLIWLKNANCSGDYRDWWTALFDVMQLNADGTMTDNGCGDTSRGGTHQRDWRLPNINELRSLINPSVDDPALPSGHPFSGVQLDVYWSSTTSADYSGWAWDVHFDDGRVYCYFKSFTHYVWPVRGGR